MRRARLNEKSKGKEKGKERWGDYYEILGMRGVEKDEMLCGVN